MVCAGSGMLDGAAKGVSILEFGAVRDCYSGDWIAHLLLQDFFRRGYPSRLQFPKGAVCIC